jgi:hypothetical protein
MVLVQRTKTWADPTSAAEDEAHEHGHEHPLGQDELVYLKKEVGEMKAHAKKKVCPHLFCPQSTLTSTRTLVVSMHTDDSCFPLVSPVREPPALHP